MDNFIILTGEGTLCKLVLDKLVNKGRKFVVLSFENNGYPKFIKNHIPDTAHDIKTMCNSIGVDSVETLINETIPTSIRKKETLPITAFESEYNFFQHINSIYTIIF